MYEDTWYSYATVHNSAQEDVASQPTKHRRKESLLQQPTVSILSSCCAGVNYWYLKQGDHQISDATEPILELFEDISALNGPPKATLAKRAKSYSNFYDAAIHYLGKDVDRKHEFDDFEAMKSHGPDSCFEMTFESFEDELVDASHEEYQYVESKILFLLS